MTDVVEEMITTALRDLPYPVSQPPGDSDAATWITWSETSQLFGQASSNVSRRTRHMLQIHAFHHRGYYTETMDSEDANAHRQALFEAIKELRKAKVRIWSTGMDELEKDTDIYHISCTAEWWEPIEQGGES